MKVVNLKKEPCDVYIGRGSIFGNPFEIGKDGNRKEVIEKFRKWLFYSDEAEEVRREIPTLKGKVLGCFCKPKKCHGDILLKIANR